MAEKTITVIVSKCVSDRVYGERLLIETFRDLKKAMAFGESKQLSGRSVLVRPNYNEEDDKGRFFREWRSVSGEAFKEIRWECR